MFKRLIFACAAVGVLFIPAPAVQAATSAYWSFDGVDDGDTFESTADASGNGFTLTGGSDTSVGGGRGTGADYRPLGSLETPNSTVPATGASNGGSAFFNTVTDAPRHFSIVDADTDGELDFAAGDAFTIEGWLRPTAYSDDLSHIVNKRGSIGAEGGRGYAIWLMANGTLRVRNDLGSGVGLEDISTTTSLPLNQWTHFAVVREASGQYSIYLNGELNATALLGAGNLANAGTFWIGSDNSGLSTRGFQGQIDELRVSDEALEPSQFLNVPEPATGLLMGIVGSVLLRRRARRTTAA